MVFEVENRPTEYDLCCGRGIATRLQATGRVRYFALGCSIHCALRQPLVLPTTCSVRADSDMVSKQGTPPEALSDSKLKTRHGCFCISYR